MLPQEVGDVAIVTEAFGKCCVRQVLLPLVLSGDAEDDSDTIVMKAIHTSQVRCLHCPRLCAVEQCRQDYSLIHHALRGDGEASTLEYRTLQTAEDTCCLGQAACYLVIQLAIVSDGAPKVREVTDHFDVASADHANVLAHRTFSDSHSLRLLDVNSEPPS